MTLHVHFNENDYQCQLEVDDGDESFPIFKRIIG